MFPVRASNVYRTTARQSAVDRQTYGTRLHRRGRSVESWTGVFFFFFRCAAGRSGRLARARNTDLSEEERVRDVSTTIRNCRASVWNRNLLLVEQSDESVTAFRVFVKTAPASSMPWKFKPSGSRCPMYKLVRSIRRIPMNDFAACRRTRRN